MNDLHTLTGVDTGKYRIATSSGTEYVLDFDTKALIRFGAPGREWDHETTFGFGPVPSDGEAFHYYRIFPVRVGVGMYADNESFWRQSSPVVSIEEIEERND